MNSGKAYVLESQLRQKVIQFENSLARIADTRKHLRDNSDLVKNEIRATFGTQLTQLRRREQQLLEALDMVVTVKDGILSQQQDQLHQALGACAQGLEWYETAVEDMKENRLVSIATVEQHINEVLKKLSIIEIKPRENSALSFEADTLAIRKAISSFGHVRTGGGTSTATKKQSLESLPAHLEDYDEDEDVVHSLLHKAVVGKNNNTTTTIFVGRPKLSSDPKDWLLREALTGRHSAPLSMDDQHHHHHHHNSAGNTNPPQFSYTKHCTTGGGGHHQQQDGRQVKGQGQQRGDHGQVHSWLHHIKDQVEYEPNVFEDFEIVKDHDVVKSSMQQQQQQQPCCDTIKAELLLLNGGEVTALFRHYFQTVLMSPSSQWLLKKSMMEKMDQQNQQQNVVNVLEDDDMDDMTVSSQSTMTYESSGDMIIPEPVTANSRLVEEETYYAELWQEFVRELWNSTDSLWLLPCCSDDESGETKTQQQQQPVVSATTCGNSAAAATERAQQQQQQILKKSDESMTMITRLITDRMKNVSLATNQHHQQHKLDHEHWLLKPITTTTDHNQPLLHQQDHQNQNQPAATNNSNYEEWLGWKRLVQKVHSMGDQYWLRQPVVVGGQNNSTPAPQPTSDKAGEEQQQRGTMMEMELQ